MAAERAVVPQVLSVAGTPIRVQIRGEGPPLLLINGIGGHLGMWEPLAQELEPTRRLILFDAPGAGLSEALPRPLRMAGLATLVVGLLDELQLQRVDVLGYSWGGALAQQVARDAHLRVRRLVLAATIPGVGGKPPPMRVAAAMLRPKRFFSPANAREASALLYGGDYRRGFPPHASALHMWHEHPPTAKGYAHQLYAIAGWTSLPWLHQIRARTLVLAGDDDPLAPSFNAHMMARLLRRGELHLVAGGGHLWLLDHAAESAAVIDEFLARS